MANIKLYKNIITTKNFVLLNTLNSDSYLTHSFLISYLTSNTLVLDTIKYIKFFNLIKWVTKKIYQQGGNILFVNSKAFINLSSIYTQIPKCFYLNDKWKGGMLTNFETMKKQLNKLKKIDLKQYTSNNIVNKKENNKLKKKEHQLRKTYEGLKNMNSLPSIIFLLTEEKVHVALNECFTLGIIPISIVNSYRLKEQSPYYIYGNQYYISFLIKDILFNITN
jgi:small subunit ribosomal protein S2